MSDTMVLRFMVAVVLGVVLMLAYVGLDHSGPCHAFTPDCPATTTTVAP